MKYILAIIFAFILSACNETKDTGLVEKMFSSNVKFEGTYASDDKTAFTFRDGVITREAREFLKERQSTYQVVGNRINFKFDNDGYFTKIDDETLSFMGIATYKKTK